MRMRRKRRLDERLASAGELLLLVEGSGFYSLPEQERKRPFDWARVFGNGNPVEVEIGCGKGGFITELARRNPSVNYIAVEKISNVIITAVEKANAENLKNLRFLNADAYNLSYYFTYPVARKIYLNFSTPYPAKGYAGRRLTHPKYLALYSQILLDGGEICQKTDDRTLFEYSLVSLSSCGYVLENVTLDLHASPMAQGNVMTEYERGFAEKGLPIYALTAVKRNANA